ncbi:MAG: hypothetical protein L0H26_13005, partial [Microlunatus sp.]|nr:hypothetical protein [Microlunatus sp.]
MRLHSRTRRVAIAVAAIVTSSALATGFLAAPAEAAGNPATKLARKLVRKTKAADANRHLIALQRISDRNGGNRAAPDTERPESPGYDASVDYVVDHLRQAGFIVRTPEFSYDVEVEVAASLTVGSKTYRIDKMSFSIDTPVGGVTGPVRVVPEDATTGCEATDFAGQDFTGTIALIRRGGCAFAQKALNAAAAGAITAVISNNVPGPLNSGTISSPGPIPVGGISQADGTTLAGQAGDTATVDMRYREETRTSVNVIAQTRTGKKNNVVMAGAHLDAIYAGINANGSGSAALL